MTFNENHNISLIFNANFINCQWFSIAFENHNISNDSDTNKIENIKKENNEEVNGNVSLNIKLITQWTYHYLGLRSAFIDIFRVISIDTGDFLRSFGSNSTVLAIF